MTEYVWVEEEDVLAIQSSLLQRYGGKPGLRDRDLLLSAIDRPRNHVAFSQVPVTVPLLSALYTSALVKNHAFFDGNKRIGLMVGVLFLELNGCEFFAEEAEAAAAIWKLAAGDLSDGGYLQFLAEHSRPRSS